MKLSEVFERIGIGDDEKARRVSNLSKARATITAEEIERGVTIERLSSIGVPVLRYATQVTIHGVLPDFAPHARPGGYCSIFQNQNGSLGVRYVAIDAEKKRLVEKASVYGKQGFRAHINSTGLEVYRFFDTKEDCVAAFKSFPRDLIYGTVCAAALATGGFVVIASVGAIQQSVLWQFINILWELSSEQQLADLVAAEQKRREASRAEFDRQLKERAEKLRAAKAEFAQTVKLPKLTRVPSRPGLFVMVASNGDSPCLRLFCLAKRGPSLCYTSATYTGQNALMPTGKMQRFDAHSQSIVQRAIDSGFAFSV